MILGFILPMDLASRGLLISDVSRCPITNIIAFCTLPGFVYISPIGRHQCLGVGIGNVLVVGGLVWWGGVVVL